MRNKSGKPVNLVFAASNRLLFLHFDEFVSWFIKHIKPISYSNYSIVGISMYIYHGYKKH